MRARQGGCRAHEEARGRSNVRRCELEHLLIDRLTNLCKDFY